MDNSQSLFARASAAAGSGNKLTAERLLDELVVTDPDNEQVWLLLAKVFDDMNEVSDWFYSWYLCSSVAIPPRPLV